MVSNCPGVMMRSSSWWRSSSSVSDAIMMMIIIIICIQCHHHHHDDHHNLCTMRSSWFVYDTIIIIRHWTHFLQSSFYHIASLSRNNSALSRNDAFTYVRTIAPFARFVAGELMRSWVVYLAAAFQVEPVVARRLFSRVAELPTPVGPTVASSSLCWERVKPTTLSNNPDHWWRPG